MIRISFILLSVFCFGLGQAKIAVDESLLSDAKNMILYWDNIESQKQSLSELPPGEKISVTVKFSQAQLVRQWNELRKNLKGKLDKLISADIKAAAKREGMSETGFLKGVYGAKYFRTEIDGVEVLRLSRPETIIKSITLEVIADKLRANANFDPLAWGLSADEIATLEDKMLVINRKIDVR